MLGKGKTGKLAVPSAPTAKTPAEAAAALALAMAEATKVAEAIQSRFDLPDVEEDEIWTAMATLQDMEGGKKRGGGRW